MNYDPRQCDGNALPTKTCVTLIQITIMKSLHIPSLCPTYCTKDCDISQLLYSVLNWFYVENEREKCKEISMLQHFLLLNVYKK